MMTMAAKIKRISVAVLAMVVISAAYFAYRLEIGITFQGQASLTHQGHIMSAMNCEIYSQEKFEEILAIQAEEPLAKGPSTDEKSFTTVFLLKGFGLAIDSNEVTLSIKSDAAAGAIYIGPFTESLRISAPERRHTQDKGWDNFSIVLANKKMRQICSASHEAQFWQPDKTVQIEMLKFREIDKNGYPVAFSVSY